jgi:hypothetical protein
MLSGSSKNEGIAEVTESLDKLANAGHLDEAIKGYEGLYSLLLAVRITENNGPPSEAHLEAADKARTKGARSARRMVADEKVAVRRAAIKSIIAKNGWSIGDRGLVDKLRAELEQLPAWKDDMPKDGTLYADVKSMKNFSTDSAEI